MKTKLALALSVLILGTSVSAATADSWGPRTSSYNGSVVVRGSGTLTRLDGGSKSVAYAADTLNDGNTVYAKTTWRKLTEVCSSLSIGGIFSVGSSSCSTTSDTAFSSKTSPEISSGYIMMNYTQSWCDSNGSNCANNGLKAIATSCAQMAFPVPDSCVYAYVEYHRP
jgi:hypothetical protein